MRKGKQWWNSKTGAFFGHIIYSHKWGLLILLISIFKSCSNFYNNYWIPISRIFNKEGADLKDLRSFYLDPENDLVSQGHRKFLVAVLEDEIVGTAALREPLKGEQ